MTDGDTRFLVRLRALTPVLAGTGLSAEKSRGESCTAGPFVGVELNHLTAPLRWLWVTYRDAAEGSLIDCAWGDDTRFDDWGPMDGNVYGTDRKAKTASRPHATPEDAAEAAVAWISAQTQRRVRREDWDGRDPRTRWTFTDTAGVLCDTRRPHWQADQAPNTSRIEEASPDHTLGAAGGKPD